MKVSFSVFSSIVVLFVLLLQSGISFASSNGCAELKLILEGTGCDGSLGYTCEPRPNVNDPRYTTVHQKNVVTGTYTTLGNYLCSPDERCPGLPDITAWTDMSTGGSATACNSGCKYYLADGNSVSNGLGQSVASGTWKPTGGACPGGDVPEIGGGNGGEQPPAPSLCATGTCYDPNKDRYCYSAGGFQTCVSGPTARGGGKGPGDTPGGGCVSGSSSAICAGPNPPPPLPPPDSPISDPTTEINDTDRFTETHTPTGGSGSGKNTTINTNVFGSGNSPTTSGQQPGDKGPATPGSTGSPPGDGDGDGKDKGSYGGGQNCGSPPVCSGDAPTCGVVTQTFLLRCGASKVDGNGNGQPDWTEIDKTKDDGYGVDEAGLSSVFVEKTVDGSGLDSSGWVGNTCPALPQAGMLHLDAHQEFFCDWLALVRVIVLICSAFVSVRILAGGAS